MAVQPPVLWPTLSTAETEPTNFASVIRYKGLIMAAAQPLMPADGAYTMHAYLDNTTPGKTRKTAMDTLFELYNDPNFAHTLVSNAASENPSADWASLDDSDVGAYIGSIDIPASSSGTKTHASLKIPSSHMVDWSRRNPHLIPILFITAGLERPDLAIEGSLPSSRAYAVKVGDHCWLVGEPEDETGKMSGFVFVANRPDITSRHDLTAQTLKSLQIAPVFVDAFGAGDVMSWGDVDPREIESCAGTF